MHIKDVSFDMLMCLYSWE